MKTVLMAIAIMLAATATFAQAKQNSAKMHHGHHYHGHHGHGAQKYTCTMHPEVVMNKPGKCPKCNMDLVPMKMKGKQMAKPMKEMKM